MDACLICWLENLFDPFGVFRQTIGIVLAVGSGLAVVYDGVARDPRDAVDDPVGDYYRDNPPDPRNPRGIQYPPIYWARDLAPDPHGYTPPIDLNTGKPFDTTEQPWYDPSRPPPGWRDAYWDRKRMRWDRGHEPQDLLGIRG